MAKYDKIPPFTKQVFLIKLHLVAIIFYSSHTHLSKNGPKFLKHRFFNYRAYLITRICIQDLQKTQIE